MHYSDEFTTFQRKILSEKMHSTQLFSKFGNLNSIIKGIFTFHGHTHLSKFNIFQKARVGKN